MRLLITITILGGLLIGTGPAEAWRPNLSSRKTTRINRTTRHLPKRLRERIERKIRRNHMRRTRVRFRSRARDRARKRLFAYKRKRLRETRRDRRRQLARLRERTQKQQRQHRISKRDVRTADRALSALVRSQKRLKKNDPRHGAVEALIASMRQFKDQRNLAAYIALSRSSLAEWAGIFAQLKKQERRAKYWQKKLRRSGKRLRNFTQGHSPTP